MSHRSAVLSAHTTTSATRAAAHTTSDPTTKEQPLHESDLHFAELTRLVDPQSREGAHITTWLKGIGDRLLAADSTKLKHEISYHLSDSKEPEAFVCMLEGKARIVVSTGLFSLIKNEDQLATVIAHELMHVRFKEHFGTDTDVIRTTKLEEYLADVAGCATWVIGAGYAPRESVALFDALNEHSKKTEIRVLRPLDAYSGVHGLGENRAQAINALVAKEIKEKGAVPSDVTPFNSETKVALKQARHVSHFDRLKADPFVIKATPEQRYHRLLDEMKAITPVTAGRIPECAAAFKELFKELPVTPAIIEDLYGALKENQIRNKTTILTEAYRACEHQGSKVPLPKEVQEIAREIKTFISARADQQLLASGAKVAEFARTWGKGDPGIRAAVKTSFVMGPFRDQSPPWPWEQHLSLARTAAARGDTSMVEALWALGAYDSRALDFAPDKLLASFNTLPQLIPCKHADSMVIDSGGIWRKSPFPPEMNTSLTARTSFESLVDAEKSTRAHRGVLASQTLQLEAANYTNLADVPAEEFARNVAGTIHYFSDELLHPDKVDILPSRRRNEADEESDHQPEDSPTDVDDDSGNPGSNEFRLSERVATHYAASGTLARKFEQMLAHSDPTVRREAAAGIRSFYLNTHGPCFESMIGRFPSDKVGEDKELLHPLVSHAISCTALTAGERVDFLRGLEDRLTPAQWNTAYFAGYDLPTNREKLRHLQSIAVHQQSAQRAGAQLILQEFKSTALRPAAILPFIAEHKAFFPALRNLGEDDRQRILDRIEALTSWDAPREQRIDLFWALEQAKLFPPNESGVRETLRQAIIGDIATITDPRERKEVAERVLLSPVAETMRISEIGLPTSSGMSPHDAGSRRQEMLNQSAGLLSLKDPFVRSAVTELWAGAVRELIADMHTGPREGRDDASAEYISRVQPYIAGIASDIKNRLPIQERRELLGALAEDLELQDTLSFFLKDSITEHSRAAVADTHEYFRSAEAGFEFINQDPWRRDAVVHFLSQPFTPHNVERFARRIDITRNRELTAVIGTVGGILNRHKTQLTDTEARLQAIDRLTHEKRWIGSLFDNASAELLSLSDKYGTGMHDTDYLAESLEDALPLAIPEEVRGNITNDIRNLFDFVPTQEAKELLHTACERVGPALQAAFDAERALFEGALTQALTKLKNLPPSPSPADLEAIRHSLLTEMADLPEYDFISKIEDRLNPANEKNELISVITQSLKGLAKSFERERSREEVRFNKEIAALVRTIERKEAQYTESLKLQPPILKEFHEKLPVVLQTFGDVLTREAYPTLYKVRDLPLEDLPTYFEADGPEFLEAPLADALSALLKERERLEDAQRILDRKVIALSEMHEEVKRNVGDLKGTPAPVSSVMEQAVRGLGFVETEYRNTPVGNFTEEILGEFNREYPHARRNSPLAVTALEEQHARQLYELFWSRSAEERAVALKLVLIPPEAEYEDRKSNKKDHFNKAFEFVADQIFPQGMKYGVESKKILRIFLEETDPALRGFMLAALMAASEKVAGAPEEYSAGKRLAMILSMLGPAEKKLGQAINSHPHTPEDLRSDTKNIKSMSDPLLRWDLVKRVREALPTEYREAALPRIGSTLGAASYYIAVDCDDSVLSILRPHARELARTGLDRMEAIAIRLSNDPELKHVAGPFVESIQQAREMIALETDHEKGVMQQRNAWKRYDGLSITVDDDTFNFHTAGWKGCGPEFRHQEKVQGEHFLDIWELDGAKDPFVRKVALAHLTAELSNILSGQPFDHDRHGSQSKIAKGNGTHAIGLFDHGCMALQPPTPEEKQQLATVLCDLIEGYLQGKSGLLERAHSIIKEHRERKGVAPAYLVSVERALLALNDFMRFDAKGESSLLQRSDLGGAIAAVFRTGDVDPVFSSTIAQRFAGTGASMFLKFLSPSQLCTKIAERIEGQATGAPSITISRTQQRVMPEPIVFDLPRMSV